MYRSADINNFRSPSASERELISELTAAKFVGRAEVIKQLQQCVVRLIDEDGSLEPGVSSDAIAAPVLYRVPT